MEIIDCKTNLEHFVDQYILNILTRTDITRKITAVNLYKILDTQFPEFKTAINFCIDNPKLRSLFQQFHFTSLGLCLCKTNAFQYKLVDMKGIIEELIIAYQKDLGVNYYEDEKVRRESHEDEVNEIRLQKEAGVLDYGQDDYDGEYENED